MTAMWFGLAAIALVGAAALLYIDHIQRRRSGRVRQIWAKAQGYTFVAEQPTLPATWRRAALAKQDYLSAVDVVSGVRRGEQFFLFDLEDTVTIVAVRRDIGSDVDLDLRPKATPPPKEADMELVGSMGPRIVFATDPEIARRVCDRRMVSFAESLPPKLQMLWSEGPWTLGSMPIASTGREWDETIDAVARLSGMLHVLPPARESHGAAFGGHDPGRPRPPVTSAPPPRAQPRPGRSGQQATDADESAPPWRPAQPAPAEADGTDDMFGSHRPVRRDPGPPPAL